MTDEKELNALIDDCRMLIAQHHQAHETGTSDGRFPELMERLLRVIERSSTKENKQ